MKTRRERQLWKSISWPRFEPNIPKVQVPCVAA
jgi:hypothetical protein